MTQRAYESLSTQNAANASGSATNFPGVPARGLANTCSCPTGPVQYEPMFVHMKKLSAKTADALDLIIEFTTLGEYGLEYPDSPDSAPSRRGVTQDCGTGDVRPRSEQGQIASRPRRSERNLEKERRTTKGSGGNLKDARTRDRQVASSALPEALRPPRIELSFT